MRAEPGLADHRRQADFNDVLTAVFAIVYQNDGDRAVLLDRLTHDRAARAAAVRALQHARCAAEDFLGGVPRHSGEGRVDVHDPRLSVPVPGFGDNDRVGSVDDRPLDEMNPPGLGRSRAGTGPAACFHNPIDRSRSREIYPPGVASAVTPARLKAAATRFVCRECPLGTQRRREFKRGVTAAGRKRLLGVVACAASICAQNAAPRLCRRTLTPGAGPR
jgi:hypothetical protein